MDLQQADFYFGELQKIFVRTGQSRDTRVVSSVTKSPVLHKWDSQRPVCLVDLERGVSSIFFFWIKLVSWGREVNHTFKWKQAYCSFLNNRKAYRYCVLEMKLKWTQFSTSETLEYCAYTGKKCAKMPLKFERTKLTASVKKKHRGLN